MPEHVILRDTQSGEAMQGLQSLSLVFHQSKTYAAGRVQNEGCSVKDAGPKGSIYLKLSFFNSGTQ